MGQDKKVLVLGAYGFVGAEVVKGILKATNLHVIATGRSQEKLNSVHCEKNDRLFLVVMDANDTGRLKELCGEAGLVINCVGPYALNGADIAKTVIDSGRNYIDFANEQNHYKKVAAFDGIACDKGVFLMTAAGLVPGFSTLLMLMAAKELGKINKLNTYYVERRRVDPEAGIASILSGVLETGYESLMLCNGKHERYKMGSFHGYADMPDPIGKIYIMAVPGADILIIPQHISVLNMQTWFGMEKPPFGFFTLTRMLKPHKNPRVYSVMKKIVTYIVKHEHERAVEKGIGPEMIFSIKAENEKDELEYQFITPDGGKGTAYFPILLAKMWEEARLPLKGFVTPVNLPDPKKIFDEIKNMGFKFELRRIK